MLYQAFGLSDAADMMKTEYIHPKTQKRLTVTVKVAFGKTFYSFNQVDWRTSVKKAFDCLSVWDQNNL